MTPPGKTIPAMSTGDVSLAYNEIPFGKAFHVIAHGLDCADKFVTDRHGHGNRFLRPLVPIVDVYVGPADRRLQYTNQHVIARSLWNRNFLEPQAKLGFRFHDGLHRFLHGKKLGESGTQESRKVRGRLRMDHCGFGKTHDFGSR
jgi:hypothetical protein